MGNFEIFGLTISWWIYVPVIYSLWVFILFIVRRFIFGYIRKFIVRTQTKLDDNFINSADLPLVILIFASGGLVIGRMIPVSSNIHLANYFLMGFKAATILAIVIFVDQSLSSLIGFYAKKIEILKTSGGIAHGLIRGVVVCLGILVLLDSFGISITPVLASLGIGSLAVALALQPTLENLFSGIQIVTDKPVQIGHFVKLESGEEGYVEKIGWRSTWIRMPQNNMIVIPNKSLVNARVINYYYPSPDLVATIDVGVQYHTDLEQAEKAAIEVGLEVMKEVSGGVKDFVPVVRFHTLGDWSIKFTVVLWAKEIGDIGLIKHEFIKRLHKKFAKEGIVIPHPVRAINYEPQKA
ncbi:MAG TPA: mechanosensitive ion channel family protein [Candidatus Omnitrophota bacterium]|nr:mechanosensitive ion channel family protein [Candidatus Omnitrophota bacterium]